MTYPLLFEAVILLIAGAFAWLAVSVNKLEEERSKKATEAKSTVARAQ